MPPDAAKDSVRVVVTDEPIDQEALRRIWRRLLLGPPLPPDEHTPPTSPNDARHERDADPHQT
jgi:hypothetical protein